MEGHGRRHQEGSRRQGRPVLCVPVGRVHNLAGGRDMQEASDGRQQGHYEHRQVLHILPHEEVHG